MVVRVSWRICSVRTDHNDVLRLVEIARVVPRGRGEQMRPPVPRHVPMLALAVGQLHGLAGSQVGDEDVRGRVHRVAASRRCGSAAARCAAPPRRARAAFVRDARRVGDAPAVSPTTPRRTPRARGAPSPGCRRRADGRSAAAPAPPAAGITNSCRCPCASSRRNAIDVPSGDQRGAAIGRAVGQARRRRRAVGRRDEYLGAIGRALDAA